MNDRTIDITVTEATAWHIWRGLVDQRAEAREELARRRSRCNRLTAPQAARAAAEHALSEQCEIVDDLTEQIEAIEQAVANGPLRIRIESVWSIALGWPVERILDADWERHYPLVRLKRVGDEVSLVVSEVIECTDELASAFEDGAYRGLRRIPDSHATCAGQWHYCDLDDGPDAIIGSDHRRDVLASMNCQIAAKRGAKNGGAQ